MLLTSSLITSNKVSTISKQDQFVIIFFLTWKVDQTVLIKITISSNKTIVLVLYKPFLENLLTNKCCFNIKLSCTVCGHFVGIIQDPRQVTGNAKSFSGTIAFSKAMELNQNFQWGEEKDFKPTKNTLPRAGYTSRYAPETAQFS